MHELHNDYPLAPENIIPEGSKVSKLIPNLQNKTKYVVHSENLKQYESLGLKTTKAHRGISFEEEAWMKAYIDLNTNLRTAATNDFEKDFFKLMNNSVFGKTMENIEKRVDIRLVTSEKEALKLSAAVNYDRCTIFDENLVAVHMRKTKLMYDKPIYLGMSILDLSASRFLFSNINSTISRWCMKSADPRSGFLNFQTVFLYFDRNSSNDVTQSTLFQASTLENKPMTLSIV